MERVAWNRRDVSGQRFGRLTALEYAGKDKSGHTLWKCRCDCGKEVVTALARMTTGMTTSCGCYRHEYLVASHTKHNMRKTRLYKLWSHMVYRATSEHYIEADRYVERGITICDEWRDFQNFADWALANGYDDKLSIDRIDNDKGYSPDNCRWADVKTQARNKGNNVVIEYNGERKTLAEWAEIYGMTYSSLYSRIRRGATIEDALNKPLRK